MRGRFWVKVFRRGGHVLVAICDEELIGKTLRDEGMNVEVRRSFYGGRNLGLDDTIKALKEGTVVNLMGNEIVSVALRLRLVHPEAIVKIANVAHAQIVHL
ncbi:TPA: DUF424 family protein [Candidatus Bathyarchaeota archaeon]|nr:DUF424 family protein [Candidatus Bathyarchaeota archaeon]